MGGSGVHLTMGLFLWNDPLHKPGTWAKPFRTKKLTTDNWAHINELNSQGLALLHGAVKSNNLVEARDLIQHGADVNLLSRSQMNPLYYAADCGYNEMVRLLLENGALIEARSVNGWNPLTIASERGYAKVAKTLIQQGADVHAATDSGWTALHSATAEGNIEILDLLINHNADVNTRQYPDSVLHWAAIKGQAQAATLLIQHGALIDFQNTSGAMPLHLAISYSHIDTIKVLLDNNANPNVVASNGLTPLTTVYQWPGVKNREKIALLLRLYGAE